LAKRKLPQKMLVTPPFCKSCGAFDVMFAVNPPSALFAIVQVYGLIVNPAVENDPAEPIIDFDVV
jgi:hypothetical protein